MWGPVLNEDHVTSKQACRICSTSGICSTPKHKPSFSIHGIGENVMQLYCESIKMANV